MDLIALLIIPGFLSFFRSYRDESSSKIESSQWILLPALLWSSLLSILFAKLFIFAAISIFGSSLWLTEYSVIKVQDITIYASEYLLALIFTYFGTFRKFEFFKSLSKLSVIDRQWLENQSKPFMLILKNEKVYIGNIYQNDYWSDHERQYVSIDPIFSGYRKGGEIVISVEYLKGRSEDSVDDKREGVIPESVLISKDEIVTSRLFDEDKFISYFLLGSVTTNQKNVFNALKSRSDRYLKKYHSNEVKEGYLEEALRKRYPEFYKDQEVSSSDV